MVSAGVEKDSHSYPTSEYDLPSPKRIALIDVPQRLLNGIAIFDPAKTLTMRKGEMNCGLSADG